MLTFLYTAFVAAAVAALLLPTAGTDVGASC
jgi:hypothetical protein